MLRIKKTTSYDIAMVGVESIPHPRVNSYTLKDTLGIIQNRELLQV